MRFFIFLIFTVILALSQVRMPLGGPSLLLGWLVALAFYGENPFDELWAFGIAVFYGFPSTFIDPWSVVYIFLVYKVLRKQRYFLGRDHFFSQSLALGILVVGLDLIEWVQLNERIRPALNEIFVLLFVHTSLTILFGLTLIYLVKKLAQTLHLRQTRLDF